ncbi:PREDICTED: liprin-alpha-2-like isoform X2 [Trachymyrmex septentrionalis]|uniref:liprin-alpha-2-like isoform X2 n=1 Tax=Trachymyrmex septentrionalis TaxID=34720 RepID=UPI00084EFEBF|nr:PREDICTED: liprin-alpha-2-like isoform X2 [Trachymyrmex septentrionalis]
MGIDSMRVGGGRCPPLLVGGLLLACLMLVCSWWTLSSENLELIRQIDDLNEQLKISAEERDQCVTLRGNLEQRFKHTEDELASLHVRLEQQMDFKKKNEELEDSVTMCKSELDSLNKLDATKTATLETLRLEKDTINTQLDVKRDENKKLQEEVDRLKGEIDQLKLSCNSPPEKKATPNLEPFETESKQTMNDSTNNSAEQDNPVVNILEDPENRARDNNGDDIQNIEETTLLPDNYEEDDKTQVATKKSGGKIISASRNIRT